MDGQSIHTPSYHDNSAKRDVIMISHQMPCIINLSALNYWHSQCAFRLLVCYKDIRISWFPDFIYKVFLSVSKRRQGATVTGKLLFHTCCIMLERWRLRLLYSNSPDQKQQPRNLIPLTHSLWWPIICLSCLKMESKGCEPVRTTAPIMHLSQGSCSSTLALTPNQHTSLHPPHPHTPSSLSLTHTHTISAHWHGRIWPCLWTAMTINN